MKKLYISESEFEAFSEAVDQCAGDMEAAEDETFIKSMEKIFMKFRQVEKRYYKLKGGDEDEKI